MLAIPFPAFDPVIVDFGPLIGLPLAIRWYSVMWLGGCVLAWLYVRRFVARPPHAMSDRDASDFLVWAILATVIGGRLGYVGFYMPGLMLDSPLSLFAVWQGGMSFHGGLIGMIVAMILFARKRDLDLWAMSDAIACAAPIGLFLVRIANFINGELYGRVTDVPWGMVFPGGGDLPRHPSQLYEALLEGLVLFLVLFAVSRSERIRMKTGMLAGIFVIGYAAARGLVELVREPDAHLGFLLGGATMGQLLSIPVLLLGVYLVIRAQRAA